MPPEFPPRIFQYTGEAATIQPAGKEAARNLSTPSKAPSNPRFNAPVLASATHHRLDRLKKGEASSMFTLYKDLPLPEKLDKKKKEEKKTPPRKPWRQTKRPENTSVLPSSKLPLPNYQLSRAIAQQGSSALPRSHIQAPGLARGSGRSMIPIAQRQQTGNVNQHQAGRGNTSTQAYINPQHAISPVLPPL